jgi:hypothetical protein
MVALVAVTLGLSAYAQPSPEIQGSYSFSRGVRATNPSRDAGGATVSGAAIALFTPLPPVTAIQDRWVVVPQLRFAYQTVRYAGVPSELAPVDQLHLYRFEVGVIQLWTPNDRLSVAAVVQPGLFTDFRGALTLDDLSLSLIGIVGWAFRPNVEVGVGVGLLTSIGRPRVLPLLSMDLELGPVSVDVLLPNQALVEAPREGPVRLGVEGRFQGGSYRLHAEGGLLPERAYQEIQIVTLGPTAAVVFRDRLRLSVLAGWQPLARLSILEGRRSEVIELQAGPGWSVSAQLTLIPDRADPDSPEVPVVPNEPGGEP